MVKVVESCVTDAHRSTSSSYRVPRRKVIFVILVKVISL